MQVREVKVETNLTSARKFGKFKVTNDDAKLMCVSARKVGCLHLVAIDTKAGNI